MILSRAGLCFALVALLTCPPMGPSAVTHANETFDRAESRERFEQAETFFKAGDFAQALANYEAGYQLAALPGFLINIAHCHRMMGDLRKARAFYRKFILVSPQSPRRREVQDFITELDRSIAENTEKPPHAPDASTAGTMTRVGGTDSATADGAAAAGRRISGGLASDAGMSPFTADQRKLWVAIASSVVGHTVALSAESP